MNGCESANENFDLMTTAAAGLLEGHTLQMLSGNIEEKEVVDENWHHGMLDCLGARLLPMVTTAYERATTKMRDAFIYQIERNTAKHSHPRNGEEEKAVTVIFWQRQFSSSSMPPCNLHQRPHSKIRTSKSPVDAKLGFVWSMSVT